jgi:HTH-type transcriptional regulator, sugar sensing transcriptional regulator
MKRVLPKYLNISAPLRNYYMEIDTKILEEIGLTNSEIKVYLALLKLGSSTKKDIVKESKITPSKLYEIADKLIDKGMVSYVRKNKVLHFNAAPPEQVLDFLESKKENITKKAYDFKKIIPQLKSMEFREEPDVEVFRGWQGMKTAYQMMLRSLKSGEIDYVIGATAGEDVKAVERFFKKVHKERREKGIILKILMGEIDKKWGLKMLPVPKYDKIKFIKNIFPSEVNIWKDNVMIAILTKIPVVTLIKSKVAAESFKSYFETLWKVALK